ncbi:MAG: hypothetical protein WCY89_00465 [Flavobacteriaceae bacterium]
MKKILLLFVLFISIQSIGQTKQEASEYLNKFFNGSSDFSKYSGSFKYNGFDNSVTFNSERQMIHPMNFEVVSVFRKKYDVLLSNIKNIEVTSDSYDGKQYVLIIQIHLKQPITEYNSEFKKGQLPNSEDKIIYKISEGFFDYGFFTKQETQNIEKAIRILFDQ